jgi:predicted RNA-binding Zn ribbon-like protein
MSKSAQSARHGTPTFELIAGNLCLDLVNTLDDRPSENPKELLSSYADLIHFCEDSGFLNLHDSEYLSKRAHEAPAKAVKAVRETARLRESIHEVFAAIVEKRGLSEPALGELNTFIQEAAGQARLEKVGGSFERRFDFRSSLHSVRWPIALAAADLLTSGNLYMIRLCSSPTCRWFFLDTSKNHRRRWCDMRLCGNRDKVSRFYARKREAGDKSD